MRIPLLYLRDKQVFRKEGGIMRLAGKPLDLAKDLKDGGIILIHLVDQDAISGMSKNFDIYSGLTYFINIQVECAPRDDLVSGLLTLKCRVVLPPDAPVARYREKKLLVAKIPPGYSGDAEGFHDVILEDADDAAIARFEALGKRVIVYEKDERKLTREVWGIISSS